MIETICSISLKGTRVGVTMGVNVLTTAATMNRSSSPKFRVAKVRETTRAMVNIVANTVKDTAGPRSCAPLFRSPSGGGIPGVALGVDKVSYKQGEPRWSSDRSALINLIVLASKYRKKSPYAEVLLTEREEFSRMRKQ